MPTELQKELSWGIRQVQETHKDSNALVEMVIGLIEDADYRKEANEDISKVNAVLPASQEEDEFGRNEVMFSHAMWDGDYTFAFETARSIAEKATSDSAAGYRGWWWYLASLAARLAGEKANEIDCLWHSSKAGVYSGFAPYLLRKRKQQIAVETDFDFPLNLESIWDTVEGWGWAGPRFDGKLEPMLNLIQSDEPTAFHQGLELLGSCLGATPTRPTSDGAPDVIWCFADECCACFEAKTMKRAAGLIYKKDLEEVNLHPDWVKHNLDQGDTKEFLRVLVSHTSNVDEIAKAFTNDIFYLSPKSLRDFAARIAAVLRTLRAKFAGRGFADAKKEFAAEIISARMDFDSIRKLLVASPLAEAAQASP